MENTEFGILRFSSFTIRLQPSVIRHLFSIFHFPFSVFSRFSALLCFVFLFGACSVLEKPKPQPFYADAAPPTQKEFRWSNGGKIPASLDPAFAAAPPETDLVRAVYEGLTDTNARTLKTVPSIAVDWTTTDGYHTWIFKLRRDAKWSNGERVTAADFVRSWNRLAALGGKIPHYNLLTNIVGVRSAENKTDSIENQNETDLLLQKDSSQNSSPLFKPEQNEATDENQQQAQKNSRTEVRSDTEADSIGEKKLPEANALKTETKTKPKTDSHAFGAVAVDDFTLRVSLVKPDKDFPALVAHPVFRPVYGDGKYFETEKLNASAITNGAFRILGVSQTNGVTLERSENFWNKTEVELERVRFVPAENAERALEAYRAGEIDAVTNADFEPLALKLLTPFDDFRQTPHSALNFYEFNRRKPPFDDRRVREALTIAVERERLTQDEMDGASVPALSFLPFAAGGDQRNLSLSQNIERARNLLAAAGFEGGENFPVVHLVVNRNNMQQRVARATAKMWKQNLNIETEIIVKEASEIEDVRQSGDFDVLRRGVVLATTDEAMNIQAIFATAPNGFQKASGEKDSTAEALKEDKKADDANAPTNSNSANKENSSGVPPTAAENQTSELSPQTSIENKGANREILTEADALNEFAAIPLYFPTTFSLVKPYIHGFDINTLDAPSLKDVRIDNDWQPKKAKSES